MTNEIIYIVTTGEYSDYHIDSVWDSLDKAEERANQIRSTTQYLNERAFVEEYYMNKSEDQRVIWTVVYDPSKDEWKCYDYNNPTSRLDKVEQLCGHNYSQCTSYRVKLRADSREAALKIANERIMRLIASNQK